MTHKKSYKVLMLETIDYHGSGIATLQELDYINSIGHSAKLIVYDKKSNHSSVIQVLPINKNLIRIIYKILNLLVIYLKALSIPVGKYKFLNSNTNKISAKKILKLYGDTPDIINIRWVSNFINYKTISELQLLTNAKVLFTMMDNAHITGGCHYPFDCKKFTENCYPCPALNNNSKFAYNTLLHKKKYLPQNAYIEATSSDCERASQSLFRYSTIIPRCSYIEYNYKFSKTKIRKEWNIDENSFVVLFGAKDVSEDRKGFKYLIESLIMLCEQSPIEKRLLLLISGGNVPNLTNMPFDIKQIGMVSEEDLFKAYYVSDIFACTSIEDSGPLMINQAFYCYTPIVSFNVGVSKDLIVHKENGYIAEKFNVEEFTNGIRFFYNLPKLDIEKTNKEIIEVLKQKKSYENLLSVMFEK